MTNLFNIIRLQGINIIEYKQFIIITLLTSLRWSLELSASWQSLGIPGPCNCSDALPLSSLVPASRPYKKIQAQLDHFLPCTKTLIMKKLPG